MTEWKPSSVEKPRDVYSALAIAASPIVAGAKWAVRPAVDAWRLLRHQRGEMETAVALRALTGTRSGWWAMGRGMGVVVLASAASALLSGGFMRFAFGHDSSGYVEALRGPYGFLVSLIMGVLGQLMNPRLWVGLCIAIMLQRYFASEMWRSEIKVLPIAAKVLVYRMLAVLFVTAVGYHLFMYAIKNAFWLTYAFLADPGVSYDQFWPWALLVGPFYIDRRHADLLEIAINEPLGHLLGVFMVFLQLAVIVTLALYLRNLVKAAFVYAIVWWFAMGALQSITIPLHGGVQWLTQKFLAGDAGVLAGNVLMWLMGFVLVVVAVGVFCRLLEGRVLSLMEE